MAIEARRLSKRFPLRDRLRVWGKAEPKTGLDCVDLEVCRGEIFGVLGPNGAGKTTLMKILCGLVLPDGGTALVNGYDVVTQSRQARRQIGMVYGDERSFYWRLSLLDNLRFYATLYGLSGAEAAARIERLVHLLGLHEHARRRMHSLSSGMKQRAAIARGIINDPPVLFMDEPTRSLDPVAADDLHSLIRERVHDGGRTVLLATNQMAEAESLCDRLTLIDRGQAVMTGTVAHFRDRMGDELAYRLVVSSGGSDWQPALMLLPGVVNAVVERGGDDLLRIDLTVQRHSIALSLVIRHLIEHRLEIRSCSKQEPGLNEVFRRVIRQRRQAEARIS